MLNNPPPAALLSFRPRYIQSAIITPMGNSQARTNWASKLGLTPANWTPAA